MTVLAVSICVTGNLHSIRDVEGSSHSVGDTEGIINEDIVSEPEVSGINTYCMMTTCRAPQPAVVVVSL